MSLRTLVLGISFSALAAVAFAGEPQIDTARVSEDIRVLSSDAYEGRGIASPAEPKVIAFISSRFQAAGLKPGGEHGGWTQEVKLRRFAISDVAASFAAPSGVIAANNGDDIVVATRGAVSDVVMQNAPLLFVGYGVKAPERQWDDFKGVDVKGKILVVLINDPDFEQPELNTFNGKAMTYYGRWTYKYEEAARLGALGVLIVHETAPASYGWATVKNSNVRPQFDIVRDNPLSVSPKLAGWITRDKTVQLFKAAGLDFEALKVAARRRDFTPVELKSVTLNLSYKVNSEIITTHNVIGILPGKSHPDETVLYSAHWDHLGVGLPDAKGDKIYNGAVDNASGVAALIELARAFGSAPQPERSIVFISYTAEESGLLGSEFYATYPVYPLAKTVAGINMDCMNVYGATRDIEIVGSGQSDLDDRVVKLAAAQGRIVNPDQTPEAGHFFRSDHFPLVKRGVPMFDPGVGQDLIKGGVAAGRAAEVDYVKFRYHQPADEWSKDWDLSGTRQDLTLFYELGRDLANSRDWPHWKPASEFKGARDVSDAQRK